MKTKPTAPKAARARPRPRPSVTADVSAETSWCAGSGVDVALPGVGGAFQGVTCPRCGAERVAKVPAKARAVPMPEHREEGAEGVVMIATPSPIEPPPDRQAVEVLTVAPAALALRQVEPEHGLLLHLEPDVERAQEYAAAASSPRTSARYAVEWRAFALWCRAQRHAFLPASGPTVAAYLSALADKGRKVAGIELALVAISQTHKLAGHESPRKHAAVERVRKGIRRTLGTAQNVRAPLLVGELRRCVEAMGQTPVEIRDRALLLLGFAAAMRRSELCALDLADVTFRPEGLAVILRRSKTDQEGAGRAVAVRPGSHPSTCPIAALRAWLALRGAAAGPLFLSVDRWGHLGQRLSGHDVARLVKRRATAAGLDPAKLSGHSLRSGLATSAAKAGKSERSIMATTGHSSVTMVRRYIRDADLFADVASDGIGL